MVGAGVVRTGVVGAAVAGVVRMGADGCAAAAAAAAAVGVVGGSVVGAAARGATEPDALAPEVRITRGIRDNGSVVVTSGRSVEGTEVLEGSAELDPTEVGVSVSTGGLAPWVPPESVLPGWTGKLEMFDASVDRGPKSVATTTTPTAGAKIASVDARGAIFFLRRACELFRFTCDPPERRALALPLLLRG